MLIVRIDKIGSYTSFHKRLDKFVKKYSARPDYILFTKKKTLKEFEEIIGCPPHPRNKVGFSVWSLNGIPILLAWQLEEL